MTDIEHHHADPSNSYEWRSELSGRVSIVETGLNELKATTAAIGQSLSDVGRTLDNLSVDMRGTRKPFNFSLLLALVSMVVLIGGGFTKLTTDPIQAQMLGLKEAQAETRESNIKIAYFQGETAATTFELRRDITAVENRQMVNVEKLNTTTEKASYERGRADAMERQLNDVDQGGTRGWMRDKAQQFLNKP